MKTPKFTLACGFVLLAASLLADVSHRIVDSSLKLAAPAGSAGDRIVFVWDTEDKGDDAAAWAHSAVVTESVPTGGANYTLDLAELGVSNGSACGLISVRSYRCLDQLGTFNGAYVETAFKDSDCHGVAFGFYATAKTSDWGNFIGTKEDVSGDDNKGFLLSLNSSNLTSWFYVNNGTRSPERPAVKTDAVNEVSFKDGVFTLNGSTIHSGLATPVGMSGLHMRVGRSQDSRIQSGWWTHVEFAGSDGKNLIEYVPVQQGDGTVGFYDKVSGAFVPPTSGTFTAGTATGATIARVMPHQAFAATGVAPITVSFRGSRLVADVPAHYAGDRLLLLWDDTDEGSEIGNWANRYELASVVKKGGGSHVVDLGRLGVRNGQPCAVVAVQQYEPLAMLEMPDTTTYVDTGVRDLDCYGLSLGFYGNECTGQRGFVLHLHRNLRSWDGFRHWHGQHLIQRLVLVLSRRQVLSASESQDGFHQRSRLRKSDVHFERFDSHADFAADHHPGGIGGRQRTEHVSGTLADRRAVPFRLVVACEFSGRQRRESHRLHPGEAHDGRKGLLL